ncbi:peptidase M56 family protein [Pseudarthrobacter sp. Y6]|uniref:peptidase M56 family protein n=1 Tax=Pseudarthrobacter sp. Y6 TaxID=3418422 RepID=UPI003CF98BFB
MNQVRVDDQFSNALRAELVTRVQKASPARKRKRVRLWLGAGALAGAGILGGVGAAAAGLFVTPGGQQVTPLSSPVAGTYEGTATIELGEPPEGTTGIEIELTCLTPGFLKIGERGAGTSCTSADLASGPHTTWGISPWVPGEDTVTITTDAETRWQLTAKYVNQETTDWALNPDGNSYGMQNENGVPDMISVVATNGIRGYVYRTQLEDADGTAAIKTFKSPAEALAWQEARLGKDFAIPVYDVTGKTVVGEFVISYAAGNSGVGGEPAVECVGVLPTLGPGETYPCPGLSPIETGYPAIPVPPN